MTDDDDLQAARQVLDGCRDAAVRAAWALWRPIADRGWRERVHDRRRKQSRRDVAGTSAGTDAGISAGTDAGISAGTDAGNSHENGALSQGQAQGRGEGGVMGGGEVLPRRKGKQRTSGGKGDRVESAREAADITRPEPPYDPEVRTIELAPAAPKAVAWSWLEPYAQAWVAAGGARFGYAKAAAPLKRLQDRFGAEEVLARWVVMLQQPDALRFASAMMLEERWASFASGRTPADARVRTPAQRARMFHAVAVAARWLTARVEGDGLWTAVQKEQARGRYRFDAQEVFAFLRRANRAQWNDRGELYLLGHTDVPALEPAEGGEDADD